MNCPQHGPECLHYRHNADNVGRDLGVGDGMRSGVAFAAEHDPMPTWEYPVSNGRGDYFAIGFFRGVIAEWCPDHPATGPERCLATWACARTIHVKTGEYAS